MAEQRVERQGMKRRGILAAAGAVVAGLLVKSAAHDALAAPITGGSDGTALIIGGGGSGCLCSPNTTTFGTSLISSNGAFPAFVGMNTGANGVGMYGQSATGYGVLGYSTGGAASLSGISTNLNIPAFAGGNSVAGGLAASFAGTVYVNGMFVVQDMTQKHGLLKHPDGSHRLMYTMEAPESWVEDFGTGTLANGRADVKLDSDLAMLIRTDTYHVFLTPHDAGNKGLAVTARKADVFSVQELHGGTSGGTFSWRVVAKPKSDRKVERLAKFTVPNVPLPDVSMLPKPVTPPTPKQP